MTSISHSVSTYLSTSQNTAELMRILYRSKKADIAPYQMNDLGIVEFHEINVKFFQLNKNNPGETYLDELRKVIPLHKWHQGKTWADFCFHLRPAIYHVIQWQQVSLITSLLTSPEGRGWLNRSYHPVPPRGGQNAYISEYPIHTVVRMACSTNSNESKQIVYTLLDLNANINQVDALGRTPLHIAVKTNSFLMMHFLIELSGIVDVDNQQIPLSQRNLCVLFGVRKTVIQKAEEILLDATPLPSVIVTIARKYLFE